MAKACCFLNKDKQRVGQRVCCACIDPIMATTPQHDDPTKLTSYLFTPPSHRLLFRGSLSVPDSRLLLDGFSFTVPIDNTRSPSIRLLQNHLALSLESMRGRSLALTGPTRVDAVLLDKMAEVDV